MRIRISGIDAALADEKRAYAEYRLFRAIAPYQSHVGAVDVGVGRDLAVQRQFLCTVAVDLGHSGRIRTRARARHPSAAIDMAADRTARLIGRRMTPRITSARRAPS